MPITYKTVRVDAETLDRLRALSGLTGSSVAELVRVLSHARVVDVVQLATLRGAAEATEGALQAAALVESGKVRP
jgi:hypothetical protein